MNRRDWSENGSEDKKVRIILMKEKIERGIWQRRELNDNEREGERERECVCVCVCVWCVTYLVVVLNNVILHVIGNKVSLDAARKRQSYSSCKRRS